MERYRVKHHQHHLGVRVEEPRQRRDGRELRVHVQAPLDVHAAKQLVGHRGAAASVGVGAAALAPPLHHLAQVAGQLFGHLLEPLDGEGACGEVGGRVRGVGAVEAPRGSPNSPPPPRTLGVDVRRLAAGAAQTFRDLHVQRELHGELRLAGARRTAELRHLAARHAAHLPVRGEQAVERLAERDDRAQQLCALHQLGR